jgi:hypothetical protein
MNMTQKTELQNQPVHPASVGKRMLQGAGIGLIVILFFLVGTAEPDPGWSKFWIIKPLIMVALAGALGGFFFYNMDHLLCQGGWREAFTYIMSLMVYLMVVWLGAVLGLNGTMWD